MTSRELLLEQHLRRLGVATSRELQALAGVSQATLSRALAGLGDRAVVIGRGRATRYALAEPAFGDGHRIPLYRISAQGRAEYLAALRPLAGGRFYLQLPSAPASSDLARDESWLLGQDGTGVFDGLPYYLDDLRPQGFLGRQLAQRLGPPYPGDIRDWTTEHIGRYLCEYGSDLPGNLLLGERTCYRFEHPLAPEPIVTEAEFPELARRAIERGMPGSSAGGEQPKFTAFTERGHVIIKFARANTEAGVRWRDLLIAENEALAQVRALGLAVADTRVVHVDDWTFLEAQRFDRVGERGRLPMLSLSAVDAEYTGHGRDWMTVAGALRARGLISEQTAEQITVLQTFGRLIWNDDMHLGNLSLRPSPIGSGPGFDLLPAYDMLPMRLSPLRTAIEFPGDTERPRHTITLDRTETVDAALAYWDRMARHAEVSASFAELAATARDVLEEALSVSVTRFSII